MKRPHRSGEHGVSGHRDHHPCEQQHNPEAVNP
jgi:hypothetical protein